MEHLTFLMGFRVSYSTVCVSLNVIVFLYYLHPFSMWNAYISFLFRPEPTTNQTSIIESCGDHFQLLCTVWALVFTAITFAAPALMKLFFPDWFATLDDKKKIELSTYASGLVHHLYVVRLKAGSLLIIFKY